MLICSHICLPLKFGTNSYCVHFIISAKSGALIMVRINVEISSLVYFIYGMNAILVNVYNKENLLCNYP